MLLANLLCGEILIQSRVVLAETLGRRSIRVQFQSNLDPVATVVFLHESFKLYQLCLWPLLLVDARMLSASPLDKALRG